MFWRVLDFLLGGYEWYRRKRGGWWVRYFNPLGGGLYYDNTEMAAHKVPEWGRAGHWRNYDLPLGHSRWLTVDEWLARTGGNQ